VYDRLDMERKKGTQLLVTHLAKGFLQHALAKGEHLGRKYKAPLIPFGFGKIAREHFSDKIWSGKNRAIVLVYGGVAAGVLGGIGLVMGAPIIAAAGVGALGLTAL
jgi:hypothetical protein